MIPKSPDIDLRPIIDELKAIDIDDTDQMIIFLRKTADFIRDIADVVSNTVLLGQAGEKAFIDKLDRIKSQIRELKLLLYKMDQESHYFDRLFNLLGSLEEELKRVEEKRLE